MAITPISTSNSQGFTLLEVLVVVLIIGILTAVVVLSLNLDGGSHQLSESAERIANSLDLAEDEAVSRQEVWGIALSGHVLQFRHWQDGPDPQWKASPRTWLDPILQLPEGISVVVDQAPGTPVAPQGLKLSDQFQPDVMLLPTGIATPVVLRLSLDAHPGLDRWIRLDALGRVDVLEEAPHASTP